LTWRKFFCSGSSAPPPPFAGAEEGPPSLFGPDGELRALARCQFPCGFPSLVELAALRKAGYDPSPFGYDPYYPEDLQAAQRLVDYWYRMECAPSRTQ